MRWLEQSGIRQNFHLLGRRQDIPRLTAALDLATSSSCGEGFPNVVGEAMACGIPCVVTDVGDSALIVGKTGKVVPPHDPEALASAWKELLRLTPQVRQKLGNAARKRVETEYSLAAAARRYEALWSIQAK